MSEIAVIAASEPTAPARPAGEGGQRAYRLTSIDMIRGLAIVIMALDFIDTKLALLYPFHRRVAGVEARRRDWWLSYL